MSDDLHLPPVKSSGFSPKPLDMDEYLKFVEFNLTLAFDKKASDEQKKRLRVPVRFKLKK